MKDSNQHHGFTLVELIVVITILAILWTIAFVSLIGFQKTAREATRMSDLNTIAKALEFYYTQENHYPDPTNSFTITFSGSTAWNQWTFWIDTQRITRRISHVPTDPLTNNEYAYSTTNTRQEYELWAISESLLTQTNSNLLFPNRANAANAYYTNIKGNYNKQIVTVKEPSRIYILWVPTIITSEINSVTIQDIIVNGTFAYRNGQNLPWSYSWNLNDWQTINDTTIFTPWAITDTSIPVIYEWTIEALNDVWERQQFADNLISYYQWSNLTDSNLPWLTKLLDTNTNTSENALSYVNTLIRTDTGGLPGNSIKIDWWILAFTLPNFCSKWIYAVWNEEFRRNSANFEAYAALKSDGSITAWWYALSWWTWAPVDTWYTDIFSTIYAFAALKSDGSISVWGDAGWGWSNAPTWSDFIKLYWLWASFAALKSDWTIEQWWAVTASLDDKLYTDEIVFVSSNLVAIAQDGSLGSTNSSYVPISNNSNFRKIYTNTYSYAALRSDGSIDAWPWWIYWWNWEPSDGWYIGINGWISAACR